MKKKHRKKRYKWGFTLIEMLAVIVLLGLLMGLLFPAISKYIIETRDNTYLLYEEDMKISTKNMMTECMEKSNNKCLPNNGEKKKITLSELVSTGYSDRLKDPKNESQECDPFKSFVAVSNKTGNLVDLTYEVCLVCGNYKTKGTVCDTPFSETCPPENDTKPPACGVSVGESTIWTNKDRTITIGCSDECSGCVQDTFSKVINTDALNTTIDIADKSGKITHCEVSAYVDKTKPTCTLEIIGDMGENGWYRATTTPRVVLKTKTDPTVNGAHSGLATYGMGTSKSNYDFNKETEYTVSDGITTVYGYVKDNAGNVGTCSTEIKYDSVVPTVETVDYGYIVYPKEDIATKDGAVITLNSYTSEYGTIYGAYIYMNSNTSGTTVTMKNGTTNLGSTTLSPGINKQRIKISAGSYNNISFTFNNATAANNVSRIELLTRTTGGFYTNKDVTLYINSIDSISGKAKYSFDNGATYQDENYNTYEVLADVNIKATDYSGNESATVLKIIDNIDKIKPNCNITFGSTSVVTHDNNYYWENVPVKLTRTDAEATTQYIKSGTRNYIVKDSEGLTTYNQVDSSTQTKDTTGHTWYGYVRDKAGNTSTCNATVKKDSQDPTCELQLTGTVGSANWYVSDTVDITFKTYKDLDKDSYQSGLATYDITTSSTATYAKNTKLTQKNDTTSITYYGYVKDKAGRTSSCSKTFKKDSTKPSCSISATGSTGTNSWFTGDVTVKINPTDATSQVNSYDLKETNSASYGNTSTLYLKSDTTSKTYYGFVKDNAGNTNTCSKTIKRDTAKPSCALFRDGNTINLDDWYSGPVVVKFNSKTDATSGIANYQIDKSSSTPSSYDGQATKTQTNDTVGVTYYGHVKDAAGHTNTCEIFFRQDSVKPRCNIVIASGTKGNNNWYTSSVKLEMRDYNDGAGTVSSGVYEYGVGPIEQYDMSVTKTHSTDGSSITYGCYIEDKAGNRNSKTITFKRDATKPYCRNNITQNYSHLGISGTVTCHDATSGCVSGSNRSFTNFIGPPVTFRVTDNAGNLSDYCGYETRDELWYFVSDCNQYYYCANASCGVSLYNYCQHSDCGTTSTTSNVLYTGCDAETRARAACATRVNANGDVITSTPVYCSDTGTGSSCDKQQCGCRKTTTTTKYCRTAGCGVYSYKSCRTAGCGCQTWGAYSTSPQETCYSSASRRCQGVAVYYHFFGQGNGY